MLEFIVLGQVPGTQFQLTFNLLAGMVALAAGLTLLVSKRCRTALYRKFITLPRS